MTHLGAIAKGVAGLVIFAACFAAPLNATAAEVCPAGWDAVQDGSCVPARLQYSSLRRLLPR